MNWKTIYTSYLKGNFATGIDLTLLSDDKILVSFVVLQRKKDILEIVNQGTDIGSFDDLFEQINAAHPTFLSIEGKGIVHKSLEVPESQGYDVIKLTNQVFPNFSEKDFWVQQEMVDSGHIFISIARNELINKTLEKFTAKGFFIFNITLGPFAINSIGSLLTDNKMLYSNTSQIGLANGIVCSVNSIENEPRDIDYVIGEEKINYKHLIAYSTSFSFFIERNTDLPLNDIVLKSQSDFLYKKGFTLLGYTFAFILFVGLLVNFLFFDHYNKRLGNLSVNYTQSKDLVNQLSQLKKEFKEKELFFADNKFLETSRSSYFADRIAYFRPGSITLTQLNIFPLEKSVRNRDEIKFKGNLIQIIGTTVDLQDINSWIQKLKKEIWVKELTLVNLRQEENISRTEFELELTIK